MGISNIWPLIWLSLDTKLGCTCTDWGDGEKHTRLERWANWQRGMVWVIRTDLQHARLQVLVHGFVPAQVNYWHYCKICLKSAGLHEFFGWFCVVWRQVTNWRNTSTLMVYLSKKILGSSFPWIVPRWRPVIMKHLHTCVWLQWNNHFNHFIVGWNIFIHLLSANKNSVVDLWKLAITGKCG